MICKIGHYSGNQQSLYHKPTLELSKQSHPEQLGLGAAREASLPRARRNKVQFECAFHDPIHDNSSVCPLLGEGYLCGNGMDEKMCFLPSTALLACQPTLLRGPDTIQIPKPKKVPKQAFLILPVNDAILLSNPSAMKAGTRSRVSSLSNPHITLILNVNFSLDWAIKLHFQH